MWKARYVKCGKITKSLYNSVRDGGARSMFQHKCVTVEDVNCNVTEILLTLSVLRVKVKVLALMDCLWSLIYACPELWIHLCLFVTACIKHSFLTVLWMLLIKVVT